MALTWLNFKKIPTDVIRVIFGKMSYKPQPAELMADVRSYTQTWSLLNAFYTARYEGDAAVGTAGGAAAWIENDLWGWANGGVALMDGFTNHMYRLWERASAFWPEVMWVPNYDVYGAGPPRRMRRPVKWYKIDCYLTSYLSRKSASSQTRIFLGMMTPMERAVFVRERLEVLGEPEANLL